jgi:hypothetical protein
MKRLIIIILFCYCLSAEAQSGYSFKDRLFFGGGFGLVVGQYTDINISPHVGYYITPRLSAGIGVKYGYYNNKYHWITGYDARGYAIFERFETHIWGGSLFKNFVLVNNVNDWIPFLPVMRIFAHAEYEALSYPKGFFKYKEPGKDLYHSYLVGGGFRLPMGRRSSFNITILWNVYSPSTGDTELSSIYGDGAIVRFSFNF